MNELIKWLNDNKILFNMIDNEVIEVVDFGKIFYTDLSGVKSIFKGEGSTLQFNLMESPEVLIEEEIFYVAFKFGNNWYYYDLREDFKLNILKYIGKRQPSKLDIPFVNLGVHTPYELLNGSGDLSQWIKKAKYLGDTAIGICDYNTMAATLNFQKECVKEGIKHIFGYSFSLKYSDEKLDMKIYCQSQQGFENLLCIQKTIMVDSKEQTITLPELIKYAEGNILVLGVLTSYQLKNSIEIISRLKQSFLKVFYQVDLSEYKAERIDIEVLQSVAYFFHNFYNHETDSFIIEPILICDNYYLDKDDARSKIILNKIASGASHRQSSEQYFKDVDEHFETIESLFDSEKWDIKKLFERMCRNTIEIADGATARYETTRNFMPRYDMTIEENKRYGDRHNMFLTLLDEGFRRLAPQGKEDEYRKRLEKEIYVLEATDNVDYLLIQWDMVNWARNNNILVGCGRGSSGGSLALYFLGITLIDPIKYNLLFERFLLPERAGLYPAQTTKISDDIKSKSYVEIEFENGNKLRLDKDAQLLVKRGEEELTIYADELKGDDTMVIDHKDYLWTINCDDNVKTDNNR